MFSFVRMFFLIASINVISTISVSAAEIRYFVVQSTGLFEIKSVNTGGRFVVQPTGEMIPVSATNPNIKQPVRGFTDRLVRGSEKFVAYSTGSGFATIRVSYTDQFTNRVVNLFSFPSSLPVSSGIQGPMPNNARMDNAFGYVTVGNRTDSRRLPLGTR